MPVRGSVLWSVTAIYSTVYAYNTFVLGAERMIAPNYWPPRLVALTLAIVQTSIYGAASTDPASAAYGTCLAGALMLGRTWRGPEPALLFLVVPVLLRRITVAGASAASYGVALLVSVASALLHWLATRPSPELRRTEAAIRASSDLQVLIVVVATSVSDLLAALEGGSAART